MDLKIAGGGGGAGGSGGNRDGGNRGKRNSRTGDRQPQQSNEDSDWNVVTTSRASRNNERIDTAKLQNLSNLSNRRDAESMTFGPGNRMGWGKGSGTAPKAPTNRYAAMQNFDSSASSANNDPSPANRKYSASMGPGYNSSRRYVFLPFFLYETVKFTFFFFHFAEITWNMNVNKPLKMSDILVTLMVPLVI